MEALHSSMLEKIMVNKISDFDEIFVSRIFGLFRPIFRFQMLWFQVVVKTFLVNNYVLDISTSAQTGLYSGSRKNQEIYC